jgi:hypothetical protein
MNSVGKNGRYFTGDERDSDEMRGGRLENRKEIALMTTTMINKMIDIKRKREKERKE